MLQEKLWKMDKKNQKMGCGEGGWENIFNETIKMSEKLTSRRSWACVFGWIIRFNEEFVAIANEPAKMIKW